jgi:hypothetical protein
MSHFHPLTDSPPNDTKTDDIYGEVQKLSEVRSVAHSEEEILDDKGLNPTLTFEEGWYCDYAMSNTCFLTIFYQIRQGVWVVTWVCLAALC